MSHKYILKLVKLGVLNTRSILGKTRKPIIYIIDLSLTPNPHYGKSGEAKALSGVIGPRGKRLKVRGLGHSFRKIRAAEQHSELPSPEEE